MKWSWNDLVKLRAVTFDDETINKSIHIELKFDKQMNILLSKYI